MDRTKKTAANAISRIFEIFIQSIFNLVVVKVTISYIGSDYNGIASTATQLLTVLSLLEGGFTLASLVKLYEPYGTGDIPLLNKYLSLTKKKFNIIGTLYLVVGVCLSLAYTPFVKTEAPFILTASIMILPVVSSAFSMCYVSKYQLIYQVSQTEYILYIIQTVVYVIMYVTEIVLVVVTKNIIAVRGCVAIFQIISCICIGLYAKKKFPYISFKEEHGDVSITGTKDVFIGQICGLVFSAAPVFFVSSFVGTAYTSVYAVYNSVLNVISSSTDAFIAAPRNALGQLVNIDSDKESLRNVYNEYEFVTSFSMAILLSVTMVLIIPFVRLYTRGVSDVNYEDFSLAILLVVNTLLYLIHIPSGTCIQVSGRFKAVRTIQTIAAITIIVMSLLGGLLYGLQGILIGKLFTSVLLAGMEILYVRKRILDSSLFEFVKVNMPSIIAAAFIAIVETALIINLEIGIIGFVLFGILLLIVNTTVLVLVNYICNKVYFMAFCLRIKTLSKGILKPWKE